VYENGCATSDVVADNGRVHDLNVFEKEGMLIVTAELPGLRKKEVEVELDDPDLVIRGERQSEKEVQDSAFSACRSTSKLPPSRSPRLSPTASWKS